MVKKLKQNIVHIFSVFAGAFNAFDKDGDGIIKLNVLEVSPTVFLLLTRYSYVLNNII